MILVTGAGGKTGRTLIKTLSRVKDVCAFVHRDDQVPVVQSSGAKKVLVGDMLDESAIRSALQNVSVIYHICPNMSPDESAIGKLVIDAAREHGIQHLVYHSVLHPQTEKMSHHWQKLRVEEMIFESGLPFTILQPAPYMQNLLANWNGIVEAGILRIPYSVNLPFSFIDLEDLAEAARVVMTEPNHSNAIYELAGTPPMSHFEVAEIFGRILKRDVRAVKQEIGDWRFRAEQNKMSEYAMENLVRMFEYYDRWGLAGNPNVLRWLLQREPTSFDTFIERTLGAQDIIS
jgi:uncharacterized protein YbjT (DUF2867 family)